MPQLRQVGRRRRRQGHGKQGTFTAFLYIWHRFPRANHLLHRRIGEGIALVRFLYSDALGV
jgi:hypothetical protein